MSLSRQHLVAKILTELVGQQVIILAMTAQSLLAGAVFPAPALCGDALEETNAVMAI